jgi:hypothetical protein
MPDRTAYLYVQISQPDFQLSSLINVFESHGFSLEFPRTTVVKTLTQLGDQVNSDRHSLLSQLRTGRSVSFQWWRNEREDLYCRIRFLKATTAIEFGLDGLDLGDESSFLQVLFDLATQYLKTGVLLGCILEHHGLEATRLDQMFVS